MDNHIDIKVSVWNRIHFSDSADMEQVIGILKAHGIDEIFDENLGFVECETLYDTEERINPEDNDGGSTIEVYAGNTLSWQNAAG